MDKHDTVRPVTPGQLKDIISTLINAVPTKHLTFETVRRIIGNKTFFIERIKDVFDQLSRPYDADEHHLGDLYITWLYKDFTPEKGKIREDLTVGEIKKLFKEQSSSKNLLVSYQGFKKIKNELRFLSFDFTIIFFTNDNNGLYFFTKGEMIPQTGWSDDSFVSKNHRLVTVR